MNKLTALMLFTSLTLSAAEYHVATTGSDTNDGSAVRPFRNISAAARIAQPGDIITVHEGIYREWVAPPRGGESDKKRITYRAAPGDKVVVTGSEPVRGWEKVAQDTWKATLPNSFFGEYNPYATRIRGDWFNSRGRPHHTGAVYLNGHWLIEAAKQAEVLAPAGATPLWFGQVEKDTTTLWAQFPGVNPNEASVEINVRPTVFTPKKTGIHYITLRGFTLRNAATNWAPPSAAQIGLVSALWCKGWVIEDNDIAYSKCSGIALGKYGDEFDNINASGAADPYTACVRRALDNGWNRETVGSHLVRNNHISHCEQTGIVGSMGAAFSVITGNEIHDIHQHRVFSGWEMSGIKFHAAVDTEISHNHIYRTGKAGLWLDWMTQGTRVVGNLMHVNDWVGDIYLEVNHGPFLLANNILLSSASLESQSDGGAYCHNLIAGRFKIRADMRRATPVLEPHGTQIASLQKTVPGDDRWYNNLLAGTFSLAGYNGVKRPVFMGGNIFTKGTQPSKLEPDALVKPGFDPGVKLEQRADGWYLTLAADPAWRDEAKRKLVTTELLGKVQLPDQPYVHPDGSPMKIDTDYFSGKRDPDHPFPGPFETAPEGQKPLKVWPKS